MNLLEFFKTKNLEKTFLIGYYGGTNYGDELLLEILQLLFFKYNARNIKIYYSNPKIFDTYHHDFGYSLVDSSKPFKVLESFFISKNIVIGGGGIWGLDFNKNIFILSLLLFLFAKVLRKKVYLLGVGYYHTTSIFGKISAYIAAKSADVILARDQETFRNFLKFNKNTILDRDISFALKEMELTNYEEDASRIAKTLGFDRKCILIGLRRFSEKNKKFRIYNDAIMDFSKEITEQNISFMIFESREVAPNLYKKIKHLEKNSKNIRAFEFKCNPISFFLALKKFASNVKIVAPQYHIQISAHFSEAQFIPISYDNKVTEFHKEIGIPSIPITESNLSKAMLLSILKKFSGRL